jgi:hypothetical protein
MMVVVGGGGGGRVGGGGGECGGVNFVFWAGVGVNFVF